MKMTNEEKAKKLIGCRKLPTFHNYTMTNAHKSLKGE